MLILKKELRYVGINVAWRIGGIMKVYRERISCRCFLFTLMLVLAIILISPSLFEAAGFAQPEQNDTKVNETGIEFQPRLGEYHYDITWGDNPAGTGVVTILRDDDVYILKARSKTRGLIDKFYRLRYVGETKIKKEELVPISTTVIDENKKRKKVQEIEYPDPIDSGSTKMVETQYYKEKQRNVQTNEYEFESETEILDIFSAIFLARSFDWLPGERHRFSMIIGTSQYEITMSCIGETHLTVGNQSIRVWVISPMAYKTSEKPTSGTKGKILVYLAADESRDLIRIKIDVGFSIVKLHLVKYFDGNGQNSIN